MADINAKENTRLVGEWLRKCGVSEDMLPSVSEVSHLYSVMRELTKDSKAAAEMVLSAVILRAVK